MTGISLSQRFLVLLISLSLVTFMVVMLLFGWSRYETDRHQLIEKLENKANIISLMLAEPLAKGDVDLIKTLTLSIITDRDFVFVQINNAGGETLDSYGSLIGTTPDYTRSLNISFANEQGLRVVGTLSLAVTLKELNSRHLQYIQTQVIFFLILVFLLVVISHYAFRKVVTDPLRQLNHSIRGYEENLTHQPIENNHKDELGQVIDAYNKMQQRQAASQKELEAYQQELEELVEKRTRELTHEARHDPLTGLFNRREFKKQITKSFSDRKQIDLALLLCFIDLDHFKIINDTHGHNVGDQLLKDFALITQKNFEDSAIIGRLGGDEFGLLIVDETLEQTLIKCEDFINLIAAHQFTHKDRYFHTTMSIGAIHLDSSVDSLDVALRNADECCYIAKERGRDRLHLYSKTDYYLSRRNQNIKWVSLIEEAINQYRMEAWWQPICSIEDPENVKWVEMLARYRDSNNNIHSAAQFLSPLEQFGVTTRLDLWMLEATLRWITKLESSQAETPLCSINISGRSISEPEFLADCLRLVAEFPAGHGKLCFEITETFAILNFEVARDFIRQLSGEGHKFALDDFGSGLSSFAYLRELEVDYLKIDGRFIKNIISNEVDRKMVSAMTEIAHTLNLKSVAEYVETEEQATMLRDLGIDFVQGNFLGEVKSPVEFVESITLKSSMAT